MLADLAALSHGANPPGPEQVLRPPRLSPRRVRHPPPVLLLTPTPITVWPAPPASSASARQIVRVGLDDRGRMDP